MPEQQTGLVITAHPGDFVWRAGGAIALHAKRGYRVKIVCLSFGERGESQFAWKEPGVTLAKVKAGRKDEAERAASLLSHALEDPYNFDHPNAAHFAQETRVVAQAMGHKPGAKYKYSAPPVFLFEPHQPEMCNYKPNLILKIDEVWEQKYKAFQILAAQKHLWAYYERVALNRGMQGSRNTAVPMTYGEAYQRLFPTVEEILK
jgi:4-oxalomesaconate hydratase